MPTRRLDVLVEDARGEPAVAVECKALGASADAEHELMRLARAAGHVPFAILVDPREIRIYRVGAQTTGRPEPAAVLPTATTFRHYDPRFGEGRVFEHTLVTLSGAWLRDVMDHWRGPEAPGEGELRRIGVLPRIAGGWTRQEVGDDAAPLFRD